MKADVYTAAVYPCVLTIAGTDPSGGAGIQADIKTISATGAYAASVITALVAQNTQGVQAIQAIPAAFVDQQLHSVFTDLSIQAIKIGMLHEAGVVAVVAAALERRASCPVVLDPVMVAKSGCALIDPVLIPLIKEKLFPRVDLITPNLPEAEKLLEDRIESVADMEQAAQALGQQYQVNVLLKGGHLAGATSADVLYTHQDGGWQWFEAPRVDTPNTHGTGCTLSSAIASYWGQGQSLTQAIQSAKNYLTQALTHGRHLNIGQGCGPVHHFWERV